MYKTHHGGRTVERTTNHSGRNGRNSNGALFTLLRAGVNGPRLCELIPFEENPNRHSLLRKGEAAAGDIIQAQEAVRPLDKEVNGALPILPVGAINEARNVKGDHGIVLQRFDVERRPSTNCPDGDRVETCHDLVDVVVRHAGPGAARVINWGNASHPRQRIKNKLSVLVPNRQNAVDNPSQPGIEQCSAGLVDFDLPVLDGLPILVGHENLRRSGILGDRESLYPKLHHGSTILKRCCRDFDRSPEKFPADSIGETSGQTNEVVRVLQTKRERRQRKFPKNVFTRGSLNLVVRDPSRETPVHRRRVDIHRTPPDLAHRPGPKGVLAVDGKRSRRWHRDRTRLRDEVEVAEHQRHEGEDGGHQTAERIEVEFPIHGLPDLLVVATVCADSDTELDPGTNDHARLHLVTGFFRRGYHRLSCLYGHRGNGFLLLRSEKDK